MNKKKLRLQIGAALCCMGIGILPIPQQTSAQTVLPGTTAGDLGSVTFTYHGTQVTYSVVRAADGRAWLQQNLGATAVASTQTPTDDQKGHLFQWGRWDDGHQLRGGATSTAFTPNNPAGIPNGSVNHITTWWNASGDAAPTNTWTAAAPSATNGKDPCAALGNGWGMPDSAAWATLKAAESITNAATAFSSNLKLPITGYRQSNGNVGGSVNNAFYWSSSVHTNANPWAFDNNASNSTFSSAYTRLYGGAVRCVYTPPCNGVPVGGKVSTTKQSVCNGENFVLTLGSIEKMTEITYQWQERPHGSNDFTDIAGADKTRLNVQNHQKTAEYRCKVTCTNTMDSSYSDTLAVAILSLPINLGGDITLCEGDTVTLDAGVGGTDYEWSNGMTSRTISVSDPDVYWARISNNAGCMGTDTITVSLLGTPSATAINAAAYGLTYAFSVANALDATTYEWTFGDGNTGNGPNPIHTYDTSGTYDVAVVLHNACDSATINRQVTVVAPTTGVGSVGENGHIKIYPVPARDVLYIAADPTIRIHDVHVFDINGKQLLRTGKPAATGTQINTTAWPSGIYLIKILSDKGSEMHRIIVE